MAPGSLSLVLMLALLGSAAAQSSTGGLAGAISCLGDAGNRDAVTQIASSCGNLASGVTASGTNVNLNCPSSCGDAFSALTASCRNQIASDATLGPSYQLIFNECRVDYTTSGGATAAPTSGAAAAPTNSTAAGGIDGSDFACLTTSANIDAGQRFAQNCAGLTPQADSGSNSGVAIDCPANCSSALQDVSPSCINTIAASATFGSVYQLIFAACDVPFSSDNSTSPASSPSSDSPSASPAASPSAASPSPAASTPTAAPTTGAVAANAPSSSATPTATPTAASPAPAPQSAVHVVANVGALAALAAASLALLA